MTDLPLSIKPRRFSLLRIVVEALYLAGVAACLLLVAFPAAPAARTFAVSAPDADLVFDGFWGAEGGDAPLRWSDGRSALRLGAFREYGALLLSAPLTAPQYLDAPDVALTLRMDGRTLATLAIPPRWRTYHVLLMPVGAVWQQSELHMDGLAPASGTNDERRLGVAIGEVRVFPQGERLALPALLRCLTVAAIAWLARDWLWRRFAPAAALIPALALTALPLLGWQVAPGAMALLQPSCWLLALIVAGGGSGLRYLLARGEDSIVWRSRAFVWLFAPLGLMLIASIVFSLGWRIGFDSAIMLYLGWLVERFGYVPYRDFFEQNMPGVYLFNAAVGRLFGYGDLGFRLADQLILLAILGSVALVMRPFGARVALAGAITFGLLYLGFGMYMGLQREFIILLPIVLALLAVHPAMAHGDIRWFYARAALAGALFGVATTVKPHAIIGLPVVVIMFGLARISTGGRWRPLLATLAVAGVGAVLPPLIVAAYLWVSGALPGFLDMALHYWPIYGRLDGVHRTTDDINYPLYLARGWLAFGGNHLWLIPAALGAALTVRDRSLPRDSRLLAQSLAMLAVVYSLYPIPAGKFWSYHWLPMLFFLTMLTALCFRDGAGRGRLAFAAPLIAGAAVVILTQPAPELLDQWIGRPIDSPKLERTDMVAQFLRKRLQPGDRVQTLDWTGGAIHGVLIAQALPATSFVEDFYFYHHISNPTIQRLQARFLAEFDQVRPRFVVQVVADDKPWVNGPDTSDTFPELDRRLAVEYQPALEAQGVVIYQRRDP